jgi:ferredoxin-type protein NapH
MKGMWQAVSPFPSQITAGPGLRALLTKIKYSLELKILKLLLAIYIGMAFVLAGLNFGYVEHAPEKTAAAISWIWHFYENWIKTGFIAAGGFLTLRITGGAQKNRLRRKNLLGFFITALVVHIAGPFIFNNPELYYFAMPLPWTNQPLQLLQPESPFYRAFVTQHGTAGIAATLFFYLLVTLVVFGGTLIRGRRWQCSTLCLFNGFASEVFAPAFPLVGQSRKAGPLLLKVFQLLRWLFLAVALFFTAYWLIILAGVPIISRAALFSQLEIYKYLAFELLATMFMWVVFTGRGYCYYCPLGTVTGLLGKAAGQRIITDVRECIDCGKCNQACPMAIDINSKAQDREAVTDLNCVGCGHCIDACPTGTLAYTTRFSCLRKVR